MTANTKQIEQLIRGANLKVTPQRFAVLSYLLQSREHPTAEQIGAAVNRDFPLASRATIYNALAALHRVGLVQEVRAADAVARYEAQSESHHHFICRICGRLEDILGDAVFPKPFVEMGDRYRIEEISLTVRGLCAGCNRAEQLSGTREECFEEDEDESKTRTGS
jgi:Fe2+ or Zn2+ uptake regulation protein